MSWKDMGAMAGCGRTVWRRGCGGGWHAAWGASVALALLFLAGCSTTGLPPDLASALNTPGALAQATATATATGTAAAATPAITPATATPTGTATPEATAGAGTPTTTPTTTTATGAASPMPTATSAPTAPPTVAPTSVPTASIPTAGKTADGCAITPAQAQAEAYLAKLVNEHRVAAGSPPLVLDQTLSLASRMHSCDMYRHQQLSHTGSDGSSPGDRISAVGPRFHTWGENIGDSRGGDIQAGITAIDRAMMDEPLTRGNHHWNIVNPAYTRLGLGVIIIGGQVWFTEDFGG